MKRQMVALVMTLAVAMAVLPQQTMAKTVDASKITFPTSRTVWSCDEHIGADDDLMLVGNHVPDDAIIVNIKSSDPKVVKIDKYTWDEDTGECNGSIFFKKKSAGTATISYDLIWGKQKRYWQRKKQLNGSGQMKHFETKITVLKYQNPCKYFKLGNTDIKKKFKKSPKNWKSVKAGQYQISIKACKGWKLTKITCTQNKTKKIKNGSKITIKKSKKNTYEVAVVTAYFNNIKTNRKRPVEIQLSAKS